MLSLPLFAFSTVHFVGTGTDAGNPFALLGIAITVLAVVALLIRRVGRSRSVPARRPVRVPGPGPVRVPAAVPVRIPVRAGSRPPE